MLAAVQGSTADARLRPHSETLSWSPLRKRKSSHFLVRTGIPEVSFGGTGWSGGPFLCVSEPSGKGAGVWWVCPGQTWSGDTEALAYVRDPSGELNVACSVNRKGTGQPWLLVRLLPTLVPHPSPYHVLIPHQPGTAFSKEQGLLRRPQVQEQGLPRTNHL